MTSLDPDNDTCAIDTYFLIGAQFICTFTDISVIATSQGTQGLSQKTLCGLVSASSLTLPIGAPPLAPFSPVALTTCKSSNVIRWLMPSHILLLLFH